MTIQNIHIYWYGTWFLWIERWIDRDWIQLCIIEKTTNKEGAKEDEEIANVGEAKPPNNQWVQVKKYLSGNNFLADCLFCCCVRILCAHYDYNMNVCKLGAAQAEQKKIGHPPCGHQEAIIIDNKQNKRMRYNM